MGLSQEWVQKIVSKKAKKRVSKKKKSVKPPAKNADLGDSKVAENQVDTKKEKISDIEQIFAFFSQDPQEKKNQLLQRCRARRDIERDNRSKASHDDYEYDSKGKIVGRKQKQYIQINEDEQKPTPTMS